MTTNNTLTEKIRNKIKDDLIYGYTDEDGQKTYPTVKEAAEWYNVSYDSLRRKAGKWKWKQKRKDHINKVAQRVAEKKKSEEICETEAEDIIKSDHRFQNAGEKLRRVINQKLDMMQTDLDGGNYVKAYDLKMIGDALKSAQEVVKIAQGEITKRIQVEEGGFKDFAKAIREGVQKGLEE